MIIGLAFVLVAVAALMLLYRSSRITNDKIHVVNTADAAAYSGAVWTARQLNFIAHTNRAIVANTLFQGHYTAYVAWVRYVKALSYNLRLRTAAIPFVNAVTLAIDEIAEIYTLLSELVGIPVITLLETSNAMLLANQAMIAYGAIPQAGRIMTQVGEVHRSEGRAVCVVAAHSTDTCDAHFPEPYESAARGIRIAESINIANLTSFYRPGTLPGDGGRFSQVVAATVEAMGEEAPQAQNWIDGRRKLQSALLDEALGTLPIPGLPSAPAEGSTDFVGNDLQAGGLFIYWAAAHGFSGQGVALEGEAYSTEFGLFKNTLMGYFDLGGQSTLLDNPLSAAGGTALAPLTNLVSLIDLPEIPRPGFLPPPDQPLYQLSLSAFASMDAATGTLLADGGLFTASALPDKLHAASRALVYYERPPGFEPVDCGPEAGTEGDCYATLFNPFWTAKLVAGPFLPSGGIAPVPLEAASRAPGVSLEEVFTPDLPDLAFEEGAGQGLAESVTPDLPVFAEDVVQ